MRNLTVDEKLLLAAAGLEMGGNARSRPKTSSSRPGGRSGNIWIRRTRRRMAGPAYPNSNRVSSRSWV